MICSNCSSGKESKKLVVLREKAREIGADFLLIEDPIDLYYLTGLKLSLGHLWIGERETVLFVDGRYLEAATQRAPCTVQLTSKEAIGALLQERKSVAFDGTKTTFRRVEELKAAYPGVEFMSFDAMTKDQRAIKSKEEILLLQQSADLLFEGYRYLEGRLREGVSEKELALEFTVFVLQRGAEALAFSPIIAFGENSALPHHRAGERKLSKGDVVLLDLGVMKGDYASDMTRVLFFEGEDPFLSNWLSLTKKAARRALDKARPGVLVKELDEAARLVYRQAGVEEYFVHSLGHGVGLEVHEFPRIRFDGKDSNTVLQEGMVITIEPGLYLPGKGGVRYEDTVVITKEGYHNLFLEEQSGG